MLKFNDYQMAWIRRWRMMVHVKAMTEQEFDRHVFEESKLVYAWLSEHEVKSLASKLLDNAQ